MNLVILKHKSENYENMEIAQGLLGNYFIMYVLYETLTHRKDNQSFSSA